MDKNIIIDWSKFKLEAKGSKLNQAKEGYINFCKILDRINFELVSDYNGSQEKVELVYKFNSNVVLNMSPNHFKNKTYKAIVKFKNNLIENGDEFIRFIGLSDGGRLIAQIKSFDSGLFDIDINNYNSFNKSRQEFYSKLKEMNGYTGCYKGANTKTNIYIDEVKLNPISPVKFKSYTYNRIFNFKNKLKENGDKFIKFVGLTDSGNLIAQIKTFDSSEVEIDISRYDLFNTSRKDTYDYCKEKGYKILSPYIKDREKILIDFNCGHDPHGIIPSHLKQNCGCPICNESKGEKFIRLYLEKKDIKFIQEYKFEDCKHKRSLPFDFYISDYNLCIEFDGIQHFKEVKHFGKKSFKDTQIRDEIKDNYCKENNINLIRIPYWELDNMEDILDKEFNKLIKIA